MPTKRSTQACAPLLVGAQDDLGVAVGAEDVAEPAQLVAELDVVVDLAVVDQRQSAVVAAHGHVAERAEVENAQALAGQGARPEDGLAAVVGSAVVLARGHASRAASCPGWDGWPSKR